MTVKKAVEKDQTYILFLVSSEFTADSPEISSNFPCHFIDVRIECIIFRKR